LICESAGPVLRIRLIAEIVRSSAWRLAPTLVFCYVPGGS
jgi:hypothetical protein